MRLDQETAFRVVNQSAEVFAEVKASLKANERLGLLADLLHIDTRTAHPALAEKRLGISFPWE